MAAAQTSKLLVLAVANENTPSPSIYRARAALDMADRPVPGTIVRAPQAEAGEDFPIICDSCLGGNPYIRMLKGTMGKECRISGRPFNAFKWQGAHNKWKETAIAPEVAREKNCCQSCLSDLEYGVPFHVRDHILDALGECPRRARSDTTP